MSTDIILKDHRDLENFGVSTVDLQELVKPRPNQTSQRKARFVPQELIDKAILNNPLEMVPRWQFSDEAKASSLFRGVLPELKSSFIQMHFLMLVDLGITLETPAGEVNRIITQAVAEKPHLGAYFAALHTAFNAFQAMFSFVEFIIEKGRFDEKHLTSVYTICNSYAAIASDVGRGAKLMSPIAKQIAFNSERYIFEIPTVLSISCLPELLLAMPVCYLGNVESSEVGDDPFPSVGTRLICDMVGSKQFAWFYQMYNRRDRSLNDFPLMDPIPSDYKEFRTQLNGLIDLEVVATPYHHVASKEWSDPSWLAGLDPIAFTIQRDIPFLVIMKRWSGNGIFPLLCNLMANTIDHITINSAKLANFNQRSYWYKGNIDNCLGNGLKTFGLEVVSKFKEGKALEFLRG